MSWICRLCCSSRNFLLTIKSPQIQLYSTFITSSFIKSQSVTINTFPICTKKFPHTIPLHTSQLFYYQKQLYSTNDVSVNTISTSNSQDQAKGRFARWTGKNAWKLALLILASSGIIGIMDLLYIYGPPQKDENGNDIEDEYSHVNTFVAYFKRTWNSLIAFNQSMQDPVSEKLLPDPMQHPYYPPYTLVLEINGVLVHPDWTFKTGWRFKKRPAMELLLQQVAPYYEVVVFTQECAMTAMPLIQQIDSKGQYIYHRLFRESTRYRRGKYIKDLSCLNRDLRKVVLVDWNSDAYQLQPRNALKIKRWKGDEQDKDLIDLAAFLRMLAMSGVDDVRPVLDHYSNQNGAEPLEVFKEKHAHLIEERLVKKEIDEKKQKFGVNAPVKSLTGGLGPTTSGMWSKSR